MILVIFKFSHFSSF